MQSSIGIGYIPSTQKAVDVSNYFYLEAGASSLYYILQVNTDCSDLTVNITRISVDYMDISIGDEILLPPIISGTGYLFMRTREPYFGVQLNAVGDLEEFQFTMYEK